MKKTFPISALILGPLFALIISAMVSPTESISSAPAAAVRLSNGFPVYVFSQPENPYEVVGKVNTTGAVRSCTIDNIVDIWASRALKKKGDGLEFDAIVGDGDDGLLVRWK